MVSDRFIESTRFKCSRCGGDCLVRLDGQTWQMTTCHDRFILSGQDDDDQGEEE